MQLYAGFALLVIAIVALITIVALVSNLINAIRRRFGRTRRLAKTRAEDDLPPIASRSRPHSPESHSNDPPLSH
jgi:uncharacterized oligopeptide transporter (OPT) family protein